MLQLMLKNVAAVLQAMMIDAAINVTKMLQPSMKDVATGEMTCYNRGGMTCFNQQNECCSRYEKMLRTVKKLLHGRLRLR